MTLDFDPAPSQVLTLVSNTSANPIDGVFTNLPDGGTIATSYGGRDFLFVANYAGGDGNDLTLTLLNPEIVVEQPLLTNIADGGTQSFGTLVLGNSVSLVFTIKNTGPGILNGLTINKSGTDQAAYTVTAAPTAPIAGPAGTTTFTVRFNPATSGEKTAAIHIASDDADENPFDITLIGQALSANDDTDLDGLNDVAEYNMRDLGFIWNSAQTVLVDIYKANANVAGYYSPMQLRALNTGTPLIARDPGTGKFKLTMDWKKSTDLTNFLDFPAPVGSSVSINPQGDVEFEFPSTDNAAFYRIEVD
jgi:trimeric autotransporter adhesin